MQEIDTYMISTLSHFDLLGKIENSSISSLGTRFFKLFKHQHMSGPSARTVKTEKHRKIHLKCMILTEDGDSA